MKHTWTKPYHGVSHLEPLPPGYQITVTGNEYRRSDVILMDLYSAKAFTPVKELVGTYDECRAAGEKWAEALLPRAHR